jgi:hypothetical protein
MMAFVVAFLPEAWLSTLHSWLGLGQMPDSVLLRYMIRGAAWSQGAFGVLFWVMASDVGRYRPLVITVAALYLAASPTFYFIDSAVGLRLAWCLWDCLCCFLIGSVLLLFSLWPSSNQTAAANHLPAESADGSGALARDGGSRESSPAVVEPGR